MSAMMEVVEWSRSPTESHVGGETDRLYFESHSGVSILLGAATAAIIGHNEGRPNY